MTPNAAKDAGLVAALSEAARADADAELAATGGPAPAAWHRLRQARGRVAEGRTRTWRLGVAVASAALACGIAWALRRPPALTYVVRGADVEANGYVRASASTPTELRFSDGTRVRLARGTRLSVGTTGPHGARLRVEDGEAHFEVEHLPGADWSVEAGPYRVAVTGTVFDLSWTGAEETAVVTMQAGSVVVTGPQLSAPIRLTSGQRFAARVASGQIRLDRIDRVERAPLPPTAPVPAEAPLPPETPAPAHARPRRADGGETPTPARVHAERWSRQVASGNATAVLAEARAHGLDTVVAGVDDEALAALADAARYSGDRETSTRALEELRRRFPSSPRAAASAFLLGRLSDDAGATKAALAWYRAYRAEAPRGPYAAEALGREMLAIERLSGRAAATAVARDYLARFPDGTYLLQARAILGLP